jgi:cysteine-rich repeat protein
MEDSASDPEPDFVCGDAAPGPGEECDDGNEVDDDDCSNDCQRTHVREVVATFEEGFDANAVAVLDGSRVVVVGEFEAGDDQQGWAAFFDDEGKILDEIILAETRGANDVAVADGVVAIRGALPPANAAYLATFSARILTPSPVWSWQLDSLVTPFMNGLAGLGDDRWAVSTGFGGGAPFFVIAEGDVELGPIGTENSIDGAIIGGEQPMFFTSFPVEEGGCQLVAWTIEDDDLHEQVVPTEPLLCPHVSAAVRLGGDRLALAIQKHTSEDRVLLEVDLSDGTTGWEVPYDGFDQVERAPDGSLFALSGQELMRVRDDGTLAWIDGLSGGDALAVRADAVFVVRDNVLIRIRLP